MHCNVQFTCAPRWYVWEYLYHKQENFIIANEPAERRRSAGEAAENSAARRMAYAKKFSIELRKCNCKV